MTHYHYSPNSNASSRTPDPSRNVTSSPAYTDSSGSNSLSRRASHDGRFSYSTLTYANSAEWYGYSSSQSGQHYYSDPSSLSSTIRHDRDNHPPVQYYNDPPVQYYHEQTSYGSQYSRTSVSSSSVSRTLSQITSGYDADYQTEQSSSSDRRTHRRPKPAHSAYTNPREYYSAEDSRGYDNHNNEGYSNPSGTRTDAGWDDYYNGHGGGINSQRSYTIPPDTIAPRTSKHRPHARRQHSAPTAQPPLTSAGLPLTRKRLAALDAENVRHGFLPRAHHTKIRQTSPPRESSAGFPPQYIVYERPRTEPARSHKSHPTAYHAVHHTVPSSQPAGIPSLPVPKNPTVVYDFLVYNKPGKLNFGKTELVRVTWQAPGKVKPWPASQTIGAKSLGVSKPTGDKTRANRSRASRTSTTKKSVRPDAGQQRREALAAMFRANSKAPSRARTV